MASTVDPSAAIHPGGGFPAEEAQQSFYAPASDAQSTRTYTSCSSASNIQQPNVPSGSTSYVPQHQFPPVQQQQQQQQQQHPYAQSYGSGMAQHQSSQHYITREPSSLSSSSSYSSSSCCEEGVHPGAGQQEAYQAYQQQQQQHQQQPNPEMANMALQFMQAIQQSVNQVVNVPDFGFDWVKPDYQFDLMADDDLADAFTTKTQSPTHQTYSISSLEDPSSPESKSSGSSCSGSTCNDLNSSMVAVENVPVTQTTMEELYEALEEYSELYDTQH
jgi:hypothetical protein